jgi:hypothetical protein
VLTAPVGETFLIMLESATSTFPAASTATPEGKAKPEAIVVTAPVGEIFLMA